MNEENSNQDGYMTQAGAPIPPIPQSVSSSVDGAADGQTSNSQYSYSYTQPVDCIPTSPVIRSSKQHRSSKVAAFVCGLLGVALGCILTVGAYSILSSQTPAQAADASVTSTDSAKVTTDSTGTVTNITVSGGSTTLAEAVASKSIPSVVSVDIYETGDMSSYGFGYGMNGNTDTTTDSEELAGTGSGVIISDDGYIITNNHVVEDASSIKVHLSDSTEYDATVVGTDASSDLAVIKIDATGLTPMDIGSSSDLNVGEWCMTIGSPFGLEQSVSSGIVSAINRSTSLSTTNGTSVYANLIQTDAAINPGNSGGALVDSEGKLIGITTLFESYSGSSSAVGFAIPIDYAYDIAEQIINNGSASHAYLGVALGTVDSSVASYYGLSVDSGAYVSSVTAGSAAEAAGLQEGDVIVAIDGDAVSTSDEAIIDIRTHKVGDSITIEYNRSGEDGTVTATLGSDSDSGAVSGATVSTTDSSASGSSTGSVSGPMGQGLPNGNGGNN